MYHYVVPRPTLPTLTFCRLILSVYDVSVAVENFESSPTVGDRTGSFASRQTGIDMAVFALSVHKEGQPDVTVQTGKEVAELLVVFFDRRGFQLRFHQRRDR